MRLTGRYIRDHIRGIGMYAGIMAIFALLFYLYNIPMDALEYALLLSLLWILGFVAADFMNCRRKHRELLRMKGILQVKWEELPKADTLAEWDYQQIVNALFESRSELESAAQLSRQDMLDYYVPVSYTHLDVYKRQAIQSARFMICGWSMELRHPIRWLTPARQNSRQRLLTTIRCLAVRMRRYRLPEGRRSWFWAPARSVSDRVSSLTSAPCTVPGHLPRKGMRRSSSIITRRPVSYTHLQLP